MRPDDYLSPAAHARDLRLLNATWAFGCDARELPNHLDSLAFTIGTLPLLAVNDHGTIRVFRNSCPHRGCELRSPGKSSGALVCGYHGWSFRADGRLAGVPRVDTFSVDPRTHDYSRALRTVPSFTAGGLVFVRGDARHDLGPATAGVEAFTTLIARAAGELETTIHHDVAANWKVLVENSLEGYHIPLVHRETLGPSSIPGGHDRYEFVNGHSEGAGGTTSSALEHWAGLLRIWPDRLLPDDFYRHRFVFPNTFVWGFFGSLIGVTSIVPTGPERSEVRIRVYRSASTTPPSATVRQAFDTILRRTVPFLTQVTYEDNRIAERQQRGLAGAEELGPLGNDEQRVAAFRATYDQAHDALIAARPAVAEPVTVEPEMERCVI